MVDFTPDILRTIPLFPMSQDYHYHQLKMDLEASWRVGNFPQVSSSKPRGVTSTLVGLQGQTAWLLTLPGLVKAAQFNCQNIDSMQGTRQPAQLSSPTQARRLSRQQP